MIGHDEVYYGLRAHTTDLLHPLLLDTCGVLEHSIGYRRVPIPNALPRTVAAAVREAWRDYSTQFDILISLIDVLRGFACLCGLHV